MIEDKDLNNNGIKVASIATEFRAKFLVPEEKQRHQRSKLASSNLVSLDQWVEMERQKEASAQYEQKQSEEIQSLLSNKIVSHKQASLDKPFEFEFKGTEVKPMSELINELRNK